jgi:predicted nuclease of restriction endonuclease-like (RecB) superfamily
LPFFNLFTKVLFILFRFHRGVKERLIYKSFVIKDDEKSGDVYGTFVGLVYSCVYVVRGVLGAVKVSKTISKSKGYNKLIINVGMLLEEARRKAYYEVNLVLVKTYWEIGRKIVEFEQKGEEKAKYGSALLDNLSKDLGRSYGKGFSRDNLERMRKFYLLFPSSETLSRNLSWSHYCLLLRVEENLARNFYFVEAEKEKWSVRELEHQISSSLFERLALSKNTKGILSLSRKGQMIEKPNDLIKDPYILDFLGLDEKEQYTERELENTIISNLQKFLLELGKGFTFVSRQQRITLEDEHFYIDLVFYNRILCCFVLLELKLGKLTHQDLGQLQMYVNYYDRKVKSKEENQTIGILLCGDKKETIVKYTLPQDAENIFAAKYKLCLPSKEELQKKFKKLLSGGIEQ